MNKRVFSLVCIILYTLLAVSTYCSEQKESDARNKSVRDGTKDNVYGRVPPNRSLDAMVKIFINNTKSVFIDIIDFEEYLENIFKNDPQQSKVLNKLFDEMFKDPTNSKPRLKVFKHYWETKSKKKLTN